MRARRLFCLLAAVSLTACAEPEEGDPLSRGANDDLGTTTESVGGDVRTARLMLQGALEPGQSAHDDYVQQSYLGWTVTVAAGERLALDITPEGETRPIAYLYGPERGAGFASLRPLHTSQADATGRARIDQVLRSGGTYLLVVGERAGLRGGFTVSRGAGGTGNTLVPGTAITVDALPATVSGATSGTSAFNRFLCDPLRAHPGAEAVYDVAVGEEGFLALQLTGATAASLDVYVMRARHGNACLDGGATRAGAWVTPGRYFVVVDSTRAGTARYDLRMALTTSAGVAEHGMDAETARLGLRAFDVAFRRRLVRTFVYAMSDFSRPSSERRQWVLDLGTSELLWNERVAHGKNSMDPEDRALANRFSNVSNSNTSSLGMMRTGATYEGTFGYSFRIGGLETGYNDRVMSRAIVVHPWFGCRDEFVSRMHYAETTWGCPAVDDRLPREYFDRVANGNAMWFYYPDGDWSTHSTFLR